MSKRNLYRVNNIKTIDIELNTIQKYILETWKDVNYAFSVSLVTNLSGETKRKVRRAIKKLEKSGLIKQLCMGNSP